MNKANNVPEIISGGIVNDRAINLVEPKILPEVKTSGFSGRVYVEVLIDEDGNVTSASYVSGNSTLKSEVEEAARQTKFSQTSLLGQSVKVRGVIIYDVNIR